MNRKNIIATTSALLILLFLYVAISKLLTFHQFTGAMYNQPLPHWFTSMLLWLLPLSEITTVLLLYIPRTRLLGFYSSTLLMLLFTGYVALILANKFDYIPCSCGGILKSMGWGTHLFFNLFFLILSITGLIAMRKQGRPPSVVV